MLIVQLINNNQYNFTVNYSDIKMSMFHFKQTAVGLANFAIQ